MSDIPSLSERRHSETSKISLPLENINSVSQGVQYGLGRNWQIPETKLEIVDLEDLVVSTPLFSLNDPFYITTAAYLKRKYYKVGSWYDANKTWKLSLAVALPPKDPFIGPEYPLLDLILSYDFPDPDEETFIFIDQFSLVFGGAGPEPPLTIGIRRGGFVLSPKTNFRVYDMIHLDKSFFQYYSRGIPEAVISWTKVTIKTFPPSPKPLYRALFLEGVQDSLCADLSLRDIASLAATNKYFSQLLRDYPTRRLRALLSDWVTDVPQFAEVLRITDAVIGGSAMLYVLCPDRSWTPGDLDIVVSNPFSQGIVTFLETQGYTYLDPREVVEPYPRPVDFVRRRFTRGSGRNQTWIDVTIIDGYRHGMRSADFITTYHSSVVMNFYNGYNLFCLFPILTFNHYNLLNYSARLYAPRYDQKYRARGFYLLESLRYIHRYTGGIRADTNDRWLFKIQSFPKPWSQKILL